MPIPPKSSRPQLLQVVLLIALALFQTAGWWGLWHWSRFKVQREARNAMSRPETPLLRLTMAVQDISKFRVGRDELRIDGEMYDIRSESSLGDSVVLVVYHDRAEAALMHVLQTGWLPGEHTNASPGSLHLWLLRCLTTPFEVPAGLYEGILWEEKPLSIDVAYFLSAGQHVPGVLALPPEG